MGKRLEIDFEQAGGSGRVVLVENRSVSDQFNNSGSDVYGALKSYCERYDACDAIRATPTQDNVTERTRRDAQAFAYCKSSLTTLYLQLYTHAPVCHSDSSVYVAGMPSSVLLSRMLPEVLSVSQLRDILGAGARIVRRTSKHEVDWECDLPAGEQKVRCVFCGFLDTRSV